MSDGPLRLVVLISGGGRTLLNLQDEIDAGRLPAQVVRVLSSRRDAAGVERARARGLPVDVVRARDCASPQAFAAELERRLAEARPDLVLLAGYLVRVPVPAWLAGRVLNIHPALLPRFGGQGMHGEHVHAAVLAAGSGESGCTVHVVDQDYDHGPILAQARVPVRADDTPATLAARVFEAECRLYPEAVLAQAERVLGRPRVAAAWAWLNAGRR